MAALRTLRVLPRVSSPNALRTFTSSSKLSDVARMQIIGRLAAAPEATQTSTGKTVFRYALGTSSGPRDNRSTSWFNVSAFVDEGERGESRGQYLASLEKGTLLFVEADSQMRTYEADDGKTHKVLNLTQRSMQVLSRPNRAADGDAELAAASG